jgi:hypothetical protein
MAGVFAIMDNIVLEYLGSEMSKYGEFRLFGSLGWALGSIVNGLLIRYFGFDLLFTFCAT